jgi:hypothetical protein
MLTYFGGGSGTLLEAGNLNRQIGNPIASNSADTTDNVLASYSMPSSSFDVAGRGLCITAQGRTGRTDNDKRVKLWFNATISAGIVEQRQHYRRYRRSDQRDGVEQQRRLAADG